MITEKVQPLSKPAQLASSVFMIRPVHFGYNPETAASNAFQVAPEPEGAKIIQKKALLEFDTFVMRLQNAGIDVITFNNTPSPYTPDSIFPNNWVTFHGDGKVVLYPMQSYNRRLEKKTEIITELELQYGFVISEIIDLSYFEEENKFLEGTGSMVLDRKNKIVYACLSPRTNPYVLDVFCRIFNYEAILFHAYDQNKIPVYHTNVMMSLGEDIAVICLTSITDKEERKKITNSLKATGKTIIEISFQQMLSFAGNMLQLQDKEGVPLMVMSHQGYESLSGKQIHKIKGLSNILYSDIRHIEKYGGGSARCMLAEIFNPRKGPEFATSHHYIG